MTAVESTLPAVPVAKLSSAGGGGSDEETVVQDIHFFSSSSSSSKFYCLTAGHDDRAVRLWNPMRTVNDDDTIEKSGSGKKKKHASYQQPSSYEKLPQVLEIQTYKDGYAYDVSSVCVARAGGGGDSNAPDLLFAACQKSVVITDLVTAKTIRRLQNFHTGKINKVSSWNQDIYISAGFDTTVALWDGRSRNNKPIQILKDATDSVTDVVCGNAVENDMGFPYLRTASVDGCVRTYDMRRGILTVDNVGSPITSMAMTGNANQPAELAVSCLDGTIRLLDCGSGGANTDILLNTYSGHHTAGNYALSVDVLANNNTIVSGSEDGSVVLYDLVSAKLQGKLQASLINPSNKPACTVAAHPKDPSILITASYDTSTVVWSHAKDTRWEHRDDE